MRGDRRSAIHQNAGGQVVLADAEGHYLYHSEHKSDWGRLLASREEKNVWRAYPQEAGRIMSSTPGVLVTASEVIAHAPILQTAPQRAGAYTLYMSAPRDLVLGSVWRYQRVSYVLLGVFILLSVPATRGSKAEPGEP